MEDAMAFLLHAEARFVLHTLLYGLAHQRLAYRIIYRAMLS